MRKVYIYTLTDPRDNLIKYIGKTLNPITRKSQHKNSRTKTKCGTWIQSLRKLELQPIFEILDETDSENWILMEKYWISQMKSWGFPIKNMTSGGESIDPEMSSRIHKGKILSEEVKGKISKTLMGKKHSEEHKSNISKNTKIALRDRNLKIGRILRQYDKKNKNLVLEYNSIADAVELTGLKQSGIANNLTGRSKSCGGFIWKWEEINNLN